MRIFSLDFSSSMAAEDSSCMVSKKPALSPTSCCKDLFSFCKNSISFVFCRISLSAASRRFLSSIFSLLSTSLGDYTFSAISFWLFLSNSSYRFFFKFFSSVAFALKASLTEARSSLSCLTYSACSYFCLFMAS